MSYSYGPSIVKDGLVLCLDAANPKSYANGSTTIYDLSGNNISASLVNGPTYSTQNKGIITLDGANDYIQNSAYTPNANTVSIWLKINANAGFPVIYVGNDVYQSAEWSWSIFSYGGALQFRGNPGGEAAIKLSPLPVGTWENWTMIRNDGTGNCKVYRNGNLFGSSGESTLTNAYNGLRIGGSGGSFGNFSLGNVSIYSRSLSSSEVLQNYNATKGRYNL